MIRRLCLRRSSCFLPTKWAGHYGVGITKWWAFLLTYKDREWALGWTNGLLLVLGQARVNGRTDGQTTDNKRIVLGAPIYKRVCLSGSLVAPGLLDRAYILCYINSCWFNRARFTTTCLSTTPCESANNNSNNSIEQQYVETQSLRKQRGLTLSGAAEAPHPSWGTSNGVCLESSCHFQLFLYLLRLWESFLDLLILGLDSTTLDPTTN